MAARATLARHEIKDIPNPQSLCTQSPNPYDVFVTSRVAIPARTRSETDVAAAAKRHAGATNKIAVTLLAVAGRESTSACSPDGSVAAKRRIYSAAPSKPTPVTTSFSPPSAPDAPSPSPEESAVHEVENATTQLWNRQAPVSGGTGAPVCATSTETLTCPSGK